MKTQTLELLESIRGPLLRDNKAICLPYVRLKLKPKLPLTGNAFEKSYLLILDIKPQYTGFATMNTLLER